MFVLALLSVRIKCLIVYIVQNHQVTAVTANIPSPTQNAVSKSINPVDINNNEADDLIAYYCQIANNENITIFSSEFLLSSLSFIK